jgi:hypothetical protein
MLSKVFPKSKFHAVSVKVFWLRDRDRGHISSHRGRRLLRRDRQSFRNRSTNDGRSLYRGYSGYNTAAWAAKGDRSLRRLAERNTSRAKDGAKITAVHVGADFDDVDV